MAEQDNRPRHADVSRWTGIAAYLRPLRSRSAARRRLSARLDEREPQHALLSTLPYAALIIGLGLITVAIVTLAVPGQYREATRPAVTAEPARPGTAPPGWIDG